MQKDMKRSKLEWWESQVKSKGKLWKEKGITFTLRKYGKGSDDALYWRTCTMEKIQSYSHKT